MVVLVVAAWTRWALDHNGGQFGAPVGDGERPIERRPFWSAADRQFAGPPTAVSAVRFAQWAGRRASRPFPWTGRRSWLPQAEDQGARRSLPPAGDRLQFDRG